MDTLLQQLTKGLDSLTGQLLLRESYEDMYGIFDHTRFSKHRPLALVAMHPKENPTSHSRLYNTIQRFCNSDINATTGLSLKEFLDLPREYVDLLFRVSTARAQTQTPGVSQAIRDIQKLERG